MSRLISTLSVSGGVCAVFSSALVFAPAARSTGQPPAGTTTVTTIEVKSTANMIQKGAPPQAPIMTKAAARQKGARQPVRIINQANRAPMIQQNRAQVRPAVRAELILVLRVCQLNTEELRRINRDAQQVVSDVVTKVVDAQLQPRVIAPGKGQSPAVLDGGKLLADALDVVMKKDLTPQQWSKYRDERDKRDAYRKECTLRFLIGAVDRELFLSPEQRTRLQESLSSNWDTGWQLYVDYLLYGNQFFPMSIDNLLNPILSDAQKTVWQNVQKVDRFFGFGGVWGGFGNDSDELEEELGEERKKQPGDYGKSGAGKLGAPKAAIKRLVAPEK